MYSDRKVKTKRNVAFLDVLGFKDYVLRHSIDEVFHHSFEEAYNDLSDTHFKRICDWIKEELTPFKYGKRTRLNLDYRISGSKVNNSKDDVKNQRFYSSGDARKYVDNTLAMLEGFEKE